MNWTSYGHQPGFSSQPRNFHIASGGTAPIEGAWDTAGESAVMDFLADFGMKLCFGSGPRQLHILLGSAASAYILHLILTRFRL